MITRPLDVASHLRSEPRGFDWLFFANGALIAVFFVFFGSRFVVSPGIAVGFELPRAPGVNANAEPTTHVITVVNAGQILAGDGTRDINHLQEWLNAEAKTVPEPSLLIRSSAGVPTAVLMQIIGMANAAHFSVRVAAEELTPESGAPHK
jgi:biopolymer transport protein ExbD